MPPEVHFECAEGAVGFAAQRPPLRGPYLFCLGRKDMEEKTAGREIALSRLIKQFVTLCVLSLHRPSSERPSGGREIGFPERTISRASRFVYAR